MRDASTLPVLPFRVFGYPARLSVLPPQAVLPEVITRPEYLSHQSKASTGQAFPLYRWPFPRLCGFPLTGFAGYV
jgi:hypothetical protein